MLLTPEQVSVRLQVSIATVRGLLLAGTLPGFRVGRQWRVGETELAAWVADQSYHQKLHGKAAEGERERRRDDVQGVREPADP